MPSSEQDLDAAKQALRVELRARRKALSPSAREEAERTLNGALSTWLSGVERLGLYAASGSELCLSALARGLSSRGVTLAWPRVVGQMLCFHCADLGSLTPGYRGLLEPSSDAPAISASELDVILVPGLGFDIEGGRLGQGGGFYDRLLRHTLGPKIIGIGFDVQLVDPLPLGPLDVRVAQVFTDKRVPQSPRWDCA